MTRDELRKYVLETLAPSLEKALRECDNLLHVSRSRVKKLSWNEKPGGLPIRKMKI